VARAIALMRDELDVTMALCGVSRVRDIGRHVLA
jgi:isopentenyl diphosphate isomerase/L-lactate dehydrogenase-like FMN-dependent dehydrogenase